MKVILRVKSLLIALALFTLMPIVGRAQDTSTTYTDQGLVTIGIGGFELEVFPATGLTFKLDATLGGAVITGLGSNTLPGGKLTIPERVMDNSLLSIDILSLSSAQRDLLLQIGGVLGIGVNITNLPEIIANILAGGIPVVGIEGTGNGATSNGISWNTALTSVSFPSSIKSIKDNAFSGTGLAGALDLSGLTNLTTIGTQAFYLCPISSVKFPASLTTISYFAFNANPNLTGDLAIPSSVTFIGQAAFYGSAIRSVTISSPSITMGWAVFGGCTGLEYIDMSTCSFASTMTPRTNSFARSIKYVPTDPAQPFAELSAHTLVYLPKDEGTATTLSTTPAESNFNFVLGGKCDWFYVQEGQNYYIPKAFTATKATWNIAGYGAGNNVTSSTRTSFSKNATAYLPFDFTLTSSGLKGYTLLDKKNTPEHVFRFTETTTFKANTPYLIRNESGGNVAGITVANVQVPITPVDGIIFAADGTPMNYNGGVTAINNPNCATTINDPVAGKWGFYGTTEAASNAMAASWNTYVLTSNEWHPFANDGVSKLVPFRAFLGSIGGAVGSKPNFTMEVIDLDGTVTAIDGVDSDEPANSVETRVYNLSGQYMGKDINTLPKGLYIVNGKKIIKK